MPILTEIRKGKEIGYTAKNTRFIWHACEICGKERWTLIMKGKPNRLLCLSCSRQGEGNSSWKGGRRLDKRGYVYVYINPDDFFHTMAADKGSAVLPFVHFGQEIYDYVNMVDARAGDSRASNVGFLTLFYKPGQFNMHIGFGRPPLGVPALQGLAAETRGGEKWRPSNENLLAMIWDLSDWFLQFEHIIDVYYPTKEEVIATFEDWREDAYFRKLTVTERLRIPFGTDKYG